MRQPISYRLDHEGSASSTYYPEIAAFTDDLLAVSEERIRPLATTYRKFLIDYELEDPRSVEEYIFELLNLGVLWRRYGLVSVAVEMAPFRFLAFLSEWRKKHQRLKPAIDLLRGVLMSFFLVPFEPRRAEFAPRDIKDLESLVRWLEATGDLREDALRFIRWLAFFASMPRSEFHWHMESIVEFADWSERYSAQRLGKYTPNVDAFVLEKTRGYRWREDRFACLRSRMEYHLNMVGAEIMNRGFRDEFLRAERKTALVPGCMRLRSEKHCEGTKTPDGIRCTGCEPACHVNRLRVSGVRQGFDVVVIPHSSDLSRWAPKPGKPVTGVVASACLSMLVQGGWELKRYGVPAQCVLLNQCGCRKHWHDEGFPTELDIRELKKLMKYPTTERTAASREIISN